jgi:CRISPR-associated protein (TIGR02584 family)
MNSITLLATIGTTPAVLTEAFYALVKYEKVHIAAIHYLTTTGGQEMIEKELLDPKTSQLKLLLEDLEIPVDLYPRVKGYIPELNGNKLSDIRNREEDEAFATTLLSLLKKLTEDGEPPVYGLLSGGRKTMSAQMHSAFQLLGRTCDKMIHVLVAREYEIRGFYYPKKNEHSTDKIIDVVQSPYVQLRHLIKPPLDFELPFKELVKSAAERIAGSQSRIHTLFFKLNDKKLYINDNPTPITFSNRPFSILLFFASLNKKYGNIQKISLSTIQQNKNYMKLFENLYVLVSKCIDIENDKWFGKKKEFQSDNNLFSRSRNTLFTSLRDGFLSLNLNEIAVEELFIYSKKVGRDKSREINAVMVPGTNIMFDDETTFMNILNDSFNIDP